MLNRHSVILTAVLAAQTAAFYVIPRSEVPIRTEPLALLPTEMHGWKMVAEHPMDPEISQVLQADDTTNRSYVKAGNASDANLFIAYFLTQRTGKIPHSPKHCMPGNGWEPIRADRMTIDAANVPGGIEVNRFVLLKGRAKTVVLYWYQTADRVIASEYAAKVYTVVDSIRKRRSDTALVRVVVRVADTGEEEAATQTAIDFVKSAFPAIQRHFAG